VSIHSDFYSQNFEDVLLARIFADIPVGFYVDAGCQDESIESVTKYFHKKGWTGINIDPIKSYIDQYTIQRPKDINLCCAVGASDGSAQFYTVFESGLSSLDRSRADFAAGLGLKTAPSTEVQVMTLNTILEAHLPPEAVITFLKVDVEGYELEAFKGLDFNRYRPKVILAETTKPCSRDLVDDYAKISQLLADNSYIRIYFDGVNTWWISAEERWRKRFFEYPVGIFDGFNPHDIGQEIKGLNLEISNLRTSIHQRSRPSLIRRLLNKIAS